MTTHQRHDPCDRYVYTGRQHFIANDVAIGLRQVTSTGMPLPVGTMFLIHFT
jgi:hypothetical protein